MTHHLSFPGWEQRERSVCRHIINAAFATHINLGGPGLLERVYERALCLELTKRKIPYRRQAGLTYGLLINFGKIRNLEGIAYVVQRRWKGQSRGRK